MGFPVPDDDVVRSTIGLSTEKCLKICCPDCPPERFRSILVFIQVTICLEKQICSSWSSMETLLRDMHAAGLRLGIATGKEQ